MAIENQSELAGFDDVVRGRFDHICRAISKADSEATHQASSPAGRGIAKALDLPSFLAHLVDELVHAPAIADAAERDVALVFIEIGKKCEPLTYRGLPALKVDWRG